MSQRTYDTNYILNDVYEDGSGLRTRRFDSNYIFNFIYDPTQPGLRVSSIQNLFGEDVELVYSGFSGNLNNTITNVQLLANAVDQLVISSNDTYTTGSILSGTTLILSRNDGVNLYTDLSPLVYTGSSSFSFTQLVNSLSGGTNIVLDVNNIDEIITINCTGSNSDIYTTGATLTDKIITFERNDDQSYNVDLTSLSNTFTYSALTLTQVDWALNTGTTFYEQSLVVGGLVSDSTTEVFFNGGDRDSYNEYIDCQVLQLSSTTNSITFESIVEPLIDINFKLRW